jgi:hypothetical protein
MFNNPLDLAQGMIKYAEQCRPELTHEQKILWALGLLAVLAFEKNHQDTIVFTRLRERIRALENRRNTPL